MASVDDYEELIATRRLNGLNDNLYKESDKNVASEEIDLTTVYMKGYADAEEKYRARIKELEEHQKKFYNGELYTAKQLKNIEKNQNKYFINRQKVKDKIDEINKKYEDSKDENGESPYYYPEYTIRVLKKLLEEK